MVTCKKTLQVKKVFISETETIHTFPIISPFAPAFYAGNPAGRRSGKVPQLENTDIRCGIG